MFATLNTHVVEFVVEPAGVAHRVTVPVAPPQSGRGCLAVRAAGAGSPRSRLYGQEKQRFQYWVHYNKTYIIHNDIFKQSH